MSTQPAVSAGKPGLAKREPVAVGGAILTILETLIFTAPDLGVSLPPSVQVIFAALVAVGGIFGVRISARPAALSVPAEPAKAKAAKKVQSTTAIETAAKAVAAVAKPNAIKDAAATAKARLKGKP